MVIEKFYGLNRRAKGERGEFEDMCNLSSEQYPCITASAGFSTVCECGEEIEAALSPDVTNTDKVMGVTGICNAAFYYNGEKKSGDIVLGVAYKKSIVRLGNLYVINLYRSGKGKMYVYNIDTDKFSVGGNAMENLIVTSGTDSTGSYLATIRYGYDGVLNYSVTDNEGQIIKVADFFKTYNNSSAVMGSDNIFERYFKIGDEVMISGFPTKSENTGQIFSYQSSDGSVLTQNALDYSENNTIDEDSFADRYEIDKYAISAAFVKDFKTSAMGVAGVTTYIHYVYLDLYNKDGDNVDFSSMLGSRTIYCMGVSLSAKQKIFDNITTHHNRLWGSVPSGNAIYASASDNIFSFSANDISLQLAARLPSSAPGHFTGFAEYNGDLIAFKEDSITVIYGSSAASYATEIIPGIGCIDGSSVAVSPSGIFFLSRNGFYITNGGAARLISQKLNTKYKSAIACFLDDKYYADCICGDSIGEMVIYDTEHSMWYRWERMEARAVYSFLGELYIADKNKIYRLNGIAQDTAEWSFTTVRDNCDTLINKAVTELWIRAKLFGGAEFSVYTSAGDGEFCYHGAYNITGTNIFRVPVRSVLADSFRIKVCGKGRVVIFEIEVKTAESGRKYIDERMKNVY